MSAAPLHSVPTGAELDPLLLRRAFGAFPSGVVAVAAEVGDQPLGLAASSFTSVSLDPPLVCFSVARASRTWPALRVVERLGVSVLSASHGAVARQLAGPVEHRFLGVETDRSDRGAITLPDGLVRFETSIHREVEAGDHLLVLLRLHAVEHADHAAPLVFHRSAFDTVAGGTV